MGQPPEALVGSGTAIAQTLMDWSEQCDRRRLQPVAHRVPECFDDFIAHVIPQLQERGAYKTRYEEGTLREKLFGRARLAWTAAQ